MITFSFRPSRWSVLPEIAASVRTRVVSWKDYLASDLGKGVVGNPNFGKPHFARLRGAQRANN